jgi:hypothetical protein
VRRNGKLFLYVLSIWCISRNECVNWLQKLLRLCNAIDDDKVTSIIIFEWFYIEISDCLARYVRHLTYAHPVAPSCWILHNTQCFYTSGIVKFCDDEIFLDAKFLFYFAFIYCCMNSGMDPTLSIVIVVFPYFLFIFTPLRFNSSRILNYSELINFINVLFNSRSVNISSNDIPVYSEFLARAMASPINFNFM